MLRQAEDCHGGAVEPGIFQGRGLDARIMKKGEHVARAVQKNIRPKKGRN
jgi:hypothetical protein